MAVHAPKDNIPQKVRVASSLGVIIRVFLVTAVLVKVPMNPLPFFVITMIKIVIINSFGALLQGSLFGMAALLPASYTTPIMVPLATARTFAAARLFAAFSLICAIASGSAMEDSFAVVTYMILPKLGFYQFYSSKGNKVGDQGTQLDLIKKGEAPDDNKPHISITTIFKKIWLMAACVCFVFTVVTMAVFPSVVVNVKSTIANGVWEGYFIPVPCFLLYNLCGWAGRCFTAVCMWPEQDSILLPGLLVARVIFIPLFMLCNVQPRSLLYFLHEAWFICFMVPFALSNGYLASLCMCYGPKKVAPHEAEIASAMMSFFLSLGMAFGAALCFLFRAVV